MSGGPHVSDRVDGTDASNVGADDASKCLPNVEDRNAERITVDLAERDVWNLFISGPYFSSICVALNKPQLKELNAQFITDALTFG